jgi:hypothetical protein
MAEKRVTLPFQRSLRFNKVPFRKFFDRIREIPVEKLSHLEHTHGEIFVSIELSNDRRYFYAHMTNAFAEWFRLNTFTGGSIELIQQRKIMTDGESQYTDEFLFLVEEAQILGSVWLDYKSKTEVENFWKLKHQIPDK